MHWYKAFFCKEQDYAIYPMNQTMFDLVAETEEEVHRQADELEKTWGATTNFQYVGDLTQEQYQGLVKAGKLICPEGRTK